MREIKEYYEIECTREFIQENYEFLDDDVAYKLAYLVRRKMFKYGITECDAIAECLDEFNIKEK